MAFSDYLKSTYKMVLYFFHVSKPIFRNLQNLYKSIWLKIHLTKKYFTKTCVQQIWFLKIQKSFLQLRFIFSIDSWNWNKMSTHCFVCVAVKVLNCKLVNCKNILTNWFANSWRGAVKLRCPSRETIPFCLIVVP